MEDDKTLLHSMGIKLDDPIPEPQPSTAPLRIVPLRSEDPEYFLIAESDFWALDQHVRGLKRQNADLQNTVQNWIQQARENDQATKQWRGAFYALAGGILAAVGMQVWFWVWG